MCRKELYVVYLTCTLVRKCCCEVTHTQLRQAFGCIRIIGVSNSSSLIWLITVSLLEYLLENCRVIWSGGKELFFLYLRFGRGNVVARRCICNREIFGRIRIIGVCSNFSIVYVVDNRVVIRRLCCIYALEEEMVS